MINDCNSYMHEKTEIYAIQWNKLIVGVRFYALILDALFSK